MTRARPRDFEATGHEGDVLVRSAGDEFDDSGRLVVEVAGEHGTITYGNRYDRVLMGGGLPDEAVEVVKSALDSRVVVEDAEVCEKEVDGDLVAWVAP